MKCRGFPLNLLKKLAEILKSCLKKNEIGARFGGDEFSAVLVSDNPGREDEFCKEFDSAMKKVGEESGKSYTLHASVGVCELKGNDTRQIFECMPIPSFTFDGGYDTICV